MFLSVNVWKKREHTKQNKHLYYHLPTQTKYSVQRFVVHSWISNKNEKHLRTICHLTLKVCRRKKKLCEFAINYFPLSNARLGPQILPSAAQRRQRAGGRPASQAMPLRPLPPARTFQRKRSFHPKALSTFPPFSSRCARAVRPLPPRPSRNKFSLKIFFTFIRVNFAFFSLS